MLLLETLKIENRNPKNLIFHQQRMNKSQIQLFGKSSEINLVEMLQNLPENLTNQVYKCRIVYDTEIQKIEFIPYTPLRIQSLKLVFSDNLDYSLKYENRSELQNLTTQKGDCDDILICQNHQIRDTSYANIVFWDGKKWLTPKTPLLEGTQRAFLLTTQQIFEAKITVSDLLKFKFARIINAMLEFNAPIFSIQNIQF